MRRCAARRGADRGLAGRRQLIEVVLQALQRCTAARGYTRAMRLIIRSARLTDCIGLRLARLLRDGRAGLEQHDDRQHLCHE